MNSGLVLARKLLYHLNHSSVWLCFHYFFKLGLAFMPRPSVGSDPPTYASQVAGIIGLQVCDTTPAFSFFPFLKKVLFSTAAAAKKSPQNSNTCISFLLREVP
jgi:hypothetical protein